MLCPKCQNTMREREKGNLVIDICPACRVRLPRRGRAFEKLTQFEQRYYDRDDDDDDRERRSTTVATWTTATASSSTAAVTVTRRRTRRKRRASSLERL